MTIDRSLPLAPRSECAPQEGDGHQQKTVEPAGAPWLRRKHGAPYSLQAWAAPTHGPSRGIGAIPVREGLAGSAQSLRQTKLFLQLVPNSLRRDWKFSLRIPLVLRTKL